MTRSPAVHYGVVPVGVVPEIGICADGTLVKLSCESRYPAVIAHAGGQVVGILVFSSRLGGGVSVRTVWVSPGYRRRGIAWRMLAVTSPTRSVSGTAMTNAGYRFLRKARAAVGAGRVVDCRRPGAHLDRLARMLVQGR